MDLAPDCCCCCFISRKSKVKLFKDILTEDDNQTYCAARFCAIVCILGFLAVALFNVIHGVEIDLEKLGMGLATTLGGSGVMIGAKAATQKSE